MIAENTLTKCTNEYLYIIPRRSCLAEHLQHVIGLCATLSVQRSVIVRSAITSPSHLSECSTKNNEPPYADRKTTAHGLKRDREVLIDMYKIE